MKWKHFLSLCVATLLIAESESGWADQYVTATNGIHKEISSGYFGMHFHNLTSPPNQTKSRTDWPTLQIGGIRLWDTNTRWGDISPSGGQWKFDQLDSLVTIASKHDTPVIYVLGSTPSWSSQRPMEQCPYGKGCSAEPVRMAHWEEYVKQVAFRYKEKINYYEIWNEPFFSEIKKEKGPSDFFYGSVKTMVQMAEMAKKIIHDANPTAKILTPGFTGNPSQLELFLSAGGKDYVDIIAFHFYSNDSDHFIKQLNEVREVMKRQGVSHLPLWNTETGIEYLQPNSNENASSANSPAQISQYLILGAASGIERFYYYAWDNTRSGVVSPNGDKLLGYDALQRTQSWLIGTRFEGCKSTSTLVTCEAVKEQTRYIYAWAKKPVASTIPIPAGYRVSAGEKLLGAPLQLSDAASKGQEAMRFDAIPIRFQLVSK